VLSFLFLFNILQLQRHQYRQKRYLAMDLFQPFQFLPNPATPRQKDRLLNMQ
jgi:hypothetical protein